MEHEFVHMKHIFIICIMFYLYGRYRIMIGIILVILILNEKKGLRKTFFNQILSEILQKKTKTANILECYSVL